MFNIIALGGCVIFFYNVGTCSRNGSVLKGILFIILSVVFWLTGEVLMALLSGSALLSIYGGVISQLVLYVLITLYRMIRNKPLYEE